MKQEIKTLKAYIEAISSVWDCPHYITMGVLLQNMLAKDNLEEDEYYCRQIVNIFNKWAKHRPDCHVSQTMSSELDMIVAGYFISKAIDNEIHEWCYDDFSYYGDD